MSVIRANTITDTAGTGAPTFSNGIKTNAILDASGGNTATINGMTPVGTDAVQTLTNKSIAASQLTGSIAPAQMNSTGSAPVYGCRAWVNFNGIGVVAILASGNVTSITDGGTGTFAINFTTAMPDANYTLVGNVDGNSRVMSMNSLAAGAANIQTRYTPSNVLQDCGINTAAIFR